MQSEPSPIQIALTPRFKRDLRDSDDSENFHHRNPVSKLSARTEKPGFLSA